MEDSFTENAMRKQLVIILTEEKDGGHFVKLAKSCNVPRKARNDIKKLIEDFLKRLINSEKSYSIKSLSQSVQSFYVTVIERFENCSIYKGINYAGRCRILDAVERYITERLHKIAFGLITVQSKEEDATIQRIIDNHYWITPKHLDAQISLESEEVRYQLELAITDLIEMNFKESTLDKLSCIALCSNRINLMFRACNKRRCTADDYLPILHYVVLKANPPLLKSNITFTQLFGLPHRIQAEEQGYYFISLCGVVEAVEEMSSSNLNITNEEYDSLLSIHANKVAPLVHLLCADSNGNPRLNFKEEITDGSRNLQGKLNEFKASFCSQFWSTFRNISHYGIIEAYDLPSRCEVDGVEGDVEEAIEADEHYRPRFSINEILDEYVIIPDSAVTSIVPYR